MRIVCTFDTIMINKYIREHKMSANRSITRVTSHLFRIPSTPKRSYVHAAYMKDTYNALRDEVKHLSPLNGAKCREIGVVERMYHMKRDCRLASINMVKELFYQLGDQFRPTQNKSNVGYSLTPKLIAKIMHHLHAGTFDLPSTRETLCSEWQELHKQLAGPKSKLSKTKIKEFLALIASSKKESGSYHTTENILLEFLSRKAETRSHLTEDYLASLHQLQPVLQQSLNSEDRFDSTNVAKGKDAIHRLTSEKNVEEKKRIIKDDHENIVAYFMISNNLPQAKQSRYSPSNNKHSYAVPDCVETAFRNLCNGLLWDGIQFNFSHLPSSLKPSQALCDFYQKQNYSTILVNHPDIGQAFFDMISGHDSLFYKQFYMHKGYELTAKHTIKNFCEVMKVLFGSTATTFKELSKQFSDKRVQRRFVQFEDDIEICISDGKNKPIIMTFVIRDHHAELRAPELFTSSNVSSTRISIPFDSDPLLSFMLEIKTRSECALINKNDLEFADLMALFLYRPHTPENAREFFKKSIPFLQMHPELKNMVLLGFPESCYCALSKTIYHEICTKKNSLVMQFIQDMTIHDLTENGLGEMLLILAVTEEEEDSTFNLIKLLLDKGVNPNIKVDETSLLFYAQSLEVTKLLIEKGVNPHEANRRGRTLLHACKNPVVVKFYLEEYKADPNARDRYDNTPLHYCNHPKIAALLLEKGADPLARNSTGQTPLYGKNNAEFVEVLLKHGADPSAKDNNGEALLLQTWLITDVAILLIKYGADLSIKADYGRTLLYVYRDRFQIVKCLLEHGADPNATSYGELTLLHHVSDPETAELLIKHGADPNSKTNSFHSTPLHIRVNNLEVAKVLLQHGADPYARNIRGETCIDLCDNPETLIDLINSIQDKRYPNKRMRTYAKVLVLGAIISAGLSFFLPRNETVFPESVNENVNGTSHGR